MLSGRIRKDDNCLVPRRRFVSAVCCLQRGNKIPTLIDELRLNDHNHNHCIHLLVHRRLVVVVLGVLRWRHADAFGDVPTIQPYEFWTSAAPPARRSRLHALDDGSSRLRRIRLVLLWNKAVDISVVQHAGLRYTVNHRFAYDDKTC